jgi:protein-disulfide isomerase
MSKRNSQASKTAARERLRAERERQAKREKVRRQLVVGGSIVAVLALAAGVGVAVSTMGGSEADVWDAAKSRKLVTPANSSGKNGTTIVIGDKKADRTIEMYEDMRCPACAYFEQETGETVMKDIESGKYKVQYTMFAFIDGPDMAGGNGSKNALSALGAALDVSPDAFLDYKQALYSKENHPEETDDKFADDSYLIKVAQQVDSLKGNREFEKAVKDGTYDRWALENAKLFGKNGVQGTPTVMYNGKKITAEGTENTPMSPDQYNAAIDKALAAK